MKKFRLRLSLRYKLLLLLTALPLVSLGMYLFMATELFQRDKVAYVFDSSATVSRSLATQVRTEMLASYMSVRNIVEDFDFANMTFASAGSRLFQKNPTMKAVLMFRKDSSGEYVNLARLVKEDAPSQAFVEDQDFVGSLLGVASKYGAHIRESSIAAGNAGIAFRLGEAEDPGHQVVVAFFQADDLVTAFGSGSFYKSLLVTKHGSVAMGTETSDTLAQLKQLDKNFAGKSPEGTAEVKNMEGDSTLVSYSLVGMGDLAVASFVEKSSALKAVDVLIAKSILFFVALLATTLLISIFASGKLTSALRDLFEATGKIAHGDFDVNIKVTSGDEVGGLAESFNTMASEVSRLMSATAEKARMQNELNTVKTVQETLFPPAVTQFGPLRIVGHFEPAAECGGDWWNYSKSGNKIYVWIGDATGHGAPAALITSAACSAVAVITGIPDMTPAKALTVLNRAIHKTSKGQINMTFFIACIDLDRNTLTYANASHESPYLMRKGATGAITKKDLTPLIEVNGPRLGDKPEFDYTETSLSVAPGDQIFFYTDGLLDVENKEGKKWGERQFLNAMIKSANLASNVDEKMLHLRSEISDYRSGKDLVDDVTMVICEIEKRAA